MMKRYQSILWIVGFGAVCLWMAYFNYKMEAMNKKAKSQAENSAKILKMGQLTARTGLVVEIFEMRTDDYTCIIPVQTRGAVIRQKLVDGMSGAPTLSCFHR